MDKPDENSSAPKPLRTRALSPERRREVERLFNVTAVSALCTDRIAGEPCQGETTDDGPHPRNCKGIMAYLKYAIRATTDGTPVAVAFGRCDLCSAIGQLIIELR